VKEVPYTRHIEPGLSSSVKLTAARSLEERLTHARTPKWRFACLREAASAKAGHAGMAVLATGGST